VLILSVAGALAASVLAGTPSAVAMPNRDTVSATAAENDNAVNTADSPPYPGVSADDCTGNYLVDTCFQKYGDKIWVRDLDPDNLYVYAYWENYLRDSSGTWRLYRWGRCEDHLGYAATWTYCDKSFYEDQTSPNALNGMGSGIRLYACFETGGCPTGYVWVRNNA
jgi:hypothetical protein